MTLFRYLSRRFTKSFMIVFMSFFGVLYLIDMIEQIRSFSGAEVDFADLARLSLLRVPASLYRILPLIVVLAAIALFLALARSSELVIIRASGQSILRMLAAPILTALAIGIFAVAVLNPIVAGTSKRYQTLASHYKNGEDSTLSVSPDGIWLRQGGADGQIVINATKANADGTRLSNVLFLAFDRDGTPIERWNADEADLLPGAWRLVNAKHWDLKAGTNAERNAETETTITLNSDLTPERIRDSFGAPKTISVWDLPAFISGLERAGFSSRSHLVWLQMELALPLLLAAMVLIAAGFTMRHARSGGSGAMVLLAIIAGFAIFFLRNFAQVLGENGQIPVAVAAWTPPAVAVLLSVSLLLHLEDG